MVSRAKSRGWSDCLTMGALGSCRSVGRRRPGSRVPWPGLSNRFAGTVPDLAWAEGANTIQFLVGRIELERISADDFNKAIYERFRQGRPRGPVLRSVQSRENRTGCRAGAVDSNPGAFPDQSSHRRRGRRTLLNEGSVEVDWHQWAGGDGVVEGPFVIDRPPPVVSGEPGRPRSEQVGALDALDVSQCCAGCRWKRSYEDRRKTPEVRRSRPPTQVGHREFVVRRAHDRWQDLGLLLGS